MRRRDFLSSLALTGLGASVSMRALSQLVPEAPRPSYQGPKVILVRFGGGVRRAETIVPGSTHAPYFLRELVPRGTFFPRMEISQLEGVATSHGQGTLYLLTGRYDRYTDVDERPLGERFEAKVPTLFEYLREAFDVPEHQTLIVNGEDRTDEEFYTFSNHHLFGVDYRSSVLSLYRYKTFLLRRSLAVGGLDEKERRARQRQLDKLEALDRRVARPSRRQSPEIEAFWDRWSGFYGETGLVNPRGDALLTELALRALRELRPRLMLINFNDPDYVHWGNAAHYTRGIATIDHGLRQLVAAVEADPEYRDDTVFVIVPDCGRDDNKLMRVPFQHHFNSRSSHDIFALVFGPGVPAGVVVERPVDQISVASTIARLMGFSARFAAGEPLAEALG